MEEVRPTRSEMLARREQIKTAQAGMELLKSKRDALLAEFMKTVDDTVKQSEELAESLKKAQYGLEVAQAIDGEAAIHSVAMATVGETLVDIEGVTIMGVSIPLVKPEPVEYKNAFTRGYSPTGVSLRIDDAALAFEETVGVIIAYAQLETRLRRLGEEIAKTNRRVNALEQLRIPELKEQVSYISSTLDERSREELFRLKKVKKNIERRKAKAAL
ncbi:MAG: V-type ATP synthase subunit D [Actinomycetia bacterium]|nr:V-type ATP synthase subunit D [Actinomycetes bacterium]